jgi:hypothetical protein
MYDPIRRGLVQGGVFKMIGLEDEAQDEWTAVIREQLSMTETPILGQENSLHDTIQCAAFRPQMNILMLRPSWL